MRVRIDAWTDFTCPFCFLATLALERLQQEVSVELHWRSFPLRPAGAPPMPANVRSMVEVEQVRVAEMAGSQYGVRLHPGPIGISTSSAHAAAKFADTQGHGDAFHRTAMKAYWLDARPLDDPRVLVDIAGKVGLENAGLVAYLEDPTLARVVESDRAEAQGNGINGVPTMIFAGKYILSGAQRYEVFKRLAERVRDEEPGRHRKYASAGD